MRFSSLDQFGVSPLKIAALGAASSSGAALFAGAAMGNVLGGGTVPALFIVGVLVFYIVVSTPRRVLDRQRVAQARESLLLSAAAKACLKVTGSRSRTVMMLQSHDPTLSMALADLGRKVLLGQRVELAVTVASGRLSSYSVAAALRSLATLRSAGFEAGDEEARGLASSAELSRETKLPIFMTACFFTPIMLLLYAVFSHSYGAGSLVELIAFEFVVLDLAFYFGASDRSPR